MEALGMIETKGYVGLVEASAIATVRSTPKRRDPRKPKATIIAARARPPVLDGAALASAEGVDVLRAAEIDRRYHFVGSGIDDGDVVVEAVGDVEMLAVR